MARKRHRRRHRNPSRNQWIAIGVGSAAVVTTGAILVVRHRRRALGVGGSGGDLQGGTGPGGGPRWQHKAELNWLCQQPGSMTASVRETLINGVFVPAMNRALAKLAAQPTIAQIEAVTAEVADNVVNQACQPVTPATRALALALSHSAWLKTQGLSGQ